MAQTSYYVPNIHVNGDLYKGRNCLSRLFSSKAEDAACARYEARVLGIIDKDLWGTWTGCRVLQQIKARTKKSVEITPYTTEDAANPLMGLHNAYAAPTNARDAAPANEVIYMGNSDDYNGRTPGWDERYDLAGYDGTGQGSDSSVHFTADLLDGSRGPGMAPDEFLLHELVHSLREMEGHMNQVPTFGTNTLYENQEEFLAILVANIYISERHGPTAPLRFGHGMGVKLPSAESTSAGFLADRDNLRQVRTLASQEGDLFGSLATVTQAPFNPIAEFWNNRTTKYK